MSPIISSACMAPNNEPIPKRPLTEEITVSTSCDYGSVKNTKQPQSYRSVINLQSQPSLEESPSSSDSRPAKLCISFVGVSDLLLITGYVIRCGQDYV